ncbi:hypothetical protein Zm00014a_019047, partial [Zea mays]
VLSFSVLLFSFPFLAKLIPILIPTYNPRLAKIKKTQMTLRRFEPATSQTNASSSYCYITCVFMSISMTGKTSTTSLPKPTLLPLHNA